MTDELLDTIRDTWDGAAESYDTDPGHGHMEEDEHRYWLRLVRELIPDHQPHRVLDVGTGPGVMAFILAEAGHTVTGLDIAPGMLEVARRHNAEKNANVRFELGAAAAPPFPAESFDVVFMRHVLWTIPNPEFAAKAWRNLIAPGGRIVIIDGIWPHGAIDSAAMFAGKVLARLTGKPAEDDHRYPDGVLEQLPMVRARSLAEPMRVLESAGFRDVAARFIQRGSSHQPHTLAERLQNRWRGYALTGVVAG